jgi:dolichyl-phosphate beta-glucosyltransferase
VSAAAPGCGLSIVIPAFREAHKITADIRAADTYLRDRRLEGEIIVVDDGSPDDTAAVARRLTPDVTGLRVIAYRPNRGKGHALRTGMAATRGDVVMFADAGLCVPYEDADVGRDLLARGVDIAVGSRRAGGAEIRRPQPLYRRVGSQAFWLVVRTSFPFGGAVHDTQCGFKIFKGAVARDVYARCVIDRMMIDIEMLSRATRLGYRLAEFPVRWTSDPDTRFRPLSGSWQNVAELCRIWWALNLASPRGEGGARRRRGGHDSL